MKKTNFKNIRTLEDIHRARQRLRKKMKMTEKSVSEKTELGKLILGAVKGTGEVLSGKSGGHESLGYLLPVVLQYVLRFLKKNTGRKQFRRLLIYSAIGGALALSVYRIINRQETERESATTV